MSTDTIQSVKERPILFSTPMVKAILEGCKTVTRRVISTQPDNECYFEMRLIDGLLTIDYNQGDENPTVKCPYAADILWVRETFTVLDYWPDSKVIQIMYEDAQTKLIELSDVEWSKFFKWINKTEKKGGIYLFKSACRLKLEILSITVERLHDITEEDAIREGVEEHWVDLTTPTLLRRNYIKSPGTIFEMDFSAKKSFETLWQSINGEESWQSNPWVWRIAFKKL
jgi:hypothetical protein